MSTPSDRPVTESAGSERAADAAFVTLTTLRLVPEVADGAFRLRRADDGHPFTVATGVDAPAFVEFVVERLLRLE